MPARDPFFRTRQAEIAANIILAELDLFRGTVFKSLDCNCMGEVYAETMRGNRLTLAWDVDHQCIRTVECITAEELNPSQVREVQLCA